NHVHLFGHILRDSLQDKYDTIVTISGIALAEPPSVLASLYDLYFDTIDLCQNSIDSSITIKNIGCDTVSLSLLSGSLTTPFSIQNGFLVPAKLPPDSMLELKFHFAPASAGSFPSYPVFEAEQQGLKRQISLRLFGIATQEGGILSSYPKKFNFPPLSICDHDSASGFITYVGCDSLRLDPAQIFGYPYYLVSGLGFRVSVKPGDTIKYKVYLDPAQKGMRTGMLVLTSHGAASETDSI